MEKNKIIRILLAIVSIIVVIVLECVSPSKFILAKTLLLFLNYIMALSFVKNGNHHALRILVVTLLYFALFSWFLPVASFQSEYAQEGFNQIGLFDLLSNYFATSIQYFGTFALFVLVVGGFYGVLHMIPGYRALVDKMVRSLEGNEKLFICVSIIMLAVITSVCGMQLGLIVFFPLLASIILLLGYDKMVVALTLAGSTVIGIMGTTISSTNVTYLVQYLAANEETVTYSTALGVRTAILLLGIVLLIVTTLRYMKKSATVTGGVAAKTTIASEDAPVIIKDITDDSKTVKKTTVKKTTVKKTTKKKSKGNNKALAMEREVIAVKEDFGNSDCDIVPSVVSGKHNTFPITIVFALLFIIFVLAYIPWSSNLGVTFFDDITKSFTEFKMFGFQIFGKILGTTKAFGTWELTDMIPVIVVFTLLLGLIYKIKFSDFIEGFAKGVKKAVIPAAIVILIYVGLVIVTFHGYQLSMYKSLFTLAHGHFNALGQVLTAFATMLAGFFNSDPTYVFNALPPYFTSLFTDGAVYDRVMVLMQSMYGLTMLVAPTSLLLLVVLSTLNVSLKDWFKNTWLLLVVLFVSIVLITIIWSPIFTWILTGLALLLLVFLVTKDWVWRIFAFICEVLIALIFIFSKPVLTGVLLGLMIIGFVMLATKDLILRLFGIAFAIMLAVMIALHVKLLTIIGIVVLILIFLGSLIYVALKG